MNGAITPHVAPAQPPAPTREFSMQFTSTPRGARLARRLVSHRLDEWGYPYDSTSNETITLLAAELTANAVRHGHAPGRDFHLELADGTRCRIQNGPGYWNDLPKGHGANPRGQPFVFALVNDQGEMTGRLHGLHEWRDSPFTDFCFNLAGDPHRGHALHLNRYGLYAWNKTGVLRAKLDAETKTFKALTTSPSPPARPTAACCWSTTSST
ncbi:ATP-binding protein [Streptomyces sp. NPDC018833]|uniref:ATP-binding protein n=1 Tax=Streptomyces sp. NPDC018833 TaxID=3365053 RepID=UPI0037AB00C4